MTLYESENAVLVLRRHQPESGDGLLCVFNLSGRSVETQLPVAHTLQDVVSGAKIDGTQPVKLDAWQFMWLR